MRSRRNLSAAAVLLLLTSGPLLSQARPTVSYPATRASDQVDVLHGERIADPFRWLEDTDAPETRSWIEAQNAVTFGYLESIPERASIRQRLTKLWDYPKYS